MRPAEIFHLLAAGDAACAPEHPLGAMLRDIVPGVAEATHEPAALRLVPVLTGREPLPADVAGLSAMVLASGELRRRLFWDPLLHTPPHDAGPDHEWQALLTALIACVESPVSGSDVPLLAPGILVEMLACAPAPVRPALVDGLLATIARGNLPDRAAVQSPRRSRALGWADSSEPEGTASMADRAAVGLAWYGLRTAPFLTAADLLRILAASDRAASGTWYEMVGWLARHPAGDGALWCTLLDRSPAAADTVVENPAALVSRDVRATLWYLAAAADRGIVSPWLPVRADGHHPADHPLTEDEDDQLIGAILGPVPPLRDDALERGDAFYGPLMSAATDLWEWRTVLHLLAQHAPQAFQSQLVAHGAAVLAAAPDAAISWLTSPHAAVRAAIIASLDAPQTTLATATLPCP